MQTNDNTAKNILLFPVQLPGDETGADISTIYSNYRFYLVTRANLFTCHVFEPTSKDYQDFHDFNAFAAKHGFSELPIDF